ncbi:MAG TPA: hypothetical protein VGE59_03210 [Patescibacteria group bacterium]
MKKEDTLSAFDNQLRDIVIALIEIIDSTDNPKTLIQLDKLVSELRPLLDLSNLNSTLGEELWLYVGIKKDANAEMANDYRESLRSLI